MMHGHGAHPGTRLGVYEVTAPLGEGGMGQVHVVLNYAQALKR